MTLRLLSPALAFLLLSGCEDLISRCYSCIGSDGSQPVAEEDVPEIKLILTQHPLPKTARNVLYTEHCGIDCNQLIRFDASLADAHAFAKAEVKKDLKPEFDPWEIYDKECPSMEMPTESWWLKAIPPGSEGGVNCTSPDFHVRLVLVPRGAEATVWVHAYTM